MWTDLFAAVGREITVQEPVMTWNLFLTAFLVPICSALTTAVLVGYISHKHKKRDEAETKIMAMQKELEEEKFKATLEWRKNHTQTLCRVKETLDVINKDLDKKVDKEECRDLREAIAR